MARTKYVEGVGVRNYTAEEETIADAIEQEHNNNLVADVLKQFKIRRNALLAATDFYALSDVTMTSDMATYRQALRDLPSGLDTVEKINAKQFPTKP
jgi:hypothetical protein